MTTKRSLLFLIHGIMGHPREFNPIVDFLESRGVDTYRVCLPKHGDKPGNLGMLSWPDFLERCQRDLDRCRESWETIHLLGFSLGGAISLILAKQNPGAFKSVTLVATPYKSLFGWEYGQYHLKYFFNRFLPGIRYHAQNDTGYPKPVLYPYDLPRFYEEMRLFFKEVRTAPPTLKAPTLLIHSPYDLTVPYEHSEWLYQSIAGETNFITLLNGGHQVFPYNVKGVVAESILNHILTTQKTTTVAHRGLER